MVAREPEYRHSVLALLVDQLGDGLVSAGFLVLLDVLGVVTHSLSIVGMATCTLVEILIASASHLYASHQRDNARARASGGAKNNEDRAGYGRQMLKSGIINLAAAAMLVGAAIGAAFFGMGAGPLLALLTCVKAVQAFNKSYATGSWGCLKFCLGSKASQQVQQDLSTTISALEIGAGALLYGGASLAMYQIAMVMSVAAPAVFLPLTLATLIIGGLMTCLPKLYFRRFCRPQEISRAS
jgi:hypothetical protein